MYIESDGKKCYREKQPLRERERESLPMLGRELLTV